MCKKLTNKRLERELLYAKDAIFKLISQFHNASTIDSSKNLYMYNYCQSALESAFNVLGIEEDYIPLMDFCEMWEDNSRAIWEMNNNDEPYIGITADIHYEYFKDEYEKWIKCMDEVALVRPECGDWEALYVNGNLVKENHRLSARQVLDSLCDPMDFDVQYIEISDDVAEMGMPDLLSKLTTHN